MTPFLWTKVNLPSRAFCPVSEVCPDRADVGVALPGLGGLALTPLRPLEREDTLSASQLEAAAAWLRARAPVTPRGPHWAGLGVALLTLVSVSLAPVVIAAGPGWVEETVSVSGSLSPTTSSTPALASRSARYFTYQERLHSVQGDHWAQAGQVWVLHSSVSSASPSHWDSPDLAGGNTHSRTLVRVPPSHDLVNILLLQY